MPPTGAQACECHCGDWDGLGGIGVYWEALGWQWAVTGGSGIYWDGALGHTGNRWEALVHTERHGSGVLGHPGGHGETLGHTEGVLSHDGARMHWCILGRRVLGLWIVLGGRGRMWAILGNEGECWERIAPVGTGVYWCLVVAAGEGKRILQTRGGVAERGVEAGWCCWWLEWEKLGGTGKNTGNRGKEGEPAEHGKWGGMGEESGQKWEKAGKNGEKQKKRAK